jgi:hypothetical protein
MWQEVPAMAKTVVVHAQQKWDYCFESRRTENALLVALAERGQHGWEAVNVLNHKDPKGETTWTAFLKRPSVGQSPGPGPQAAAKPAEEQSSQPQGFDLSGDQFQLKTE